jgi:hypothetical protein
LVLLPVPRCDDDFFLLLDFLPSVSESDEDEEDATEVVQSVSLSLPVEGVELSLLSRFLLLLLDLDPDPFELAFTCRLLLEELFPFDDFCVFRSPTISATRHFFSISSPPSFNRVMLGDLMAWAWASKIYAPKLKPKPLTHHKSPDPKTLIPTIIALLLNSPLPPPPSLTRNQNRSRLHFT